MSQEPQKSKTAEREEAILAFWNKEKIFEKSLKKTSPKGEFVFYDGPPFATGLPHSGSLLSSVSKDVIPRYKTMRGYHVRRRWGWDTHGLPIESLVEKKLELKTKKDILDIGIEKFNEEARSMVFEYVNEWKRYIERLGRWVDFDNSYKTLDPTYTESVWWGLKEIYKKGNLYEGYKVLMYCPHCETPLAKAEIAMDNTYKDVTDEAVTVKFRLKNPEQLQLDKPTFVMAWTTTPWTLPGNVALAVGDDIDYAIVERGDEYLIFAKELAKSLEFSLENARYKKGSELVGLLYEPLYKVAKVEAHNRKKYQVVAADFVTTEDGTGVVHTAVMYGEDDFNLGKQEGLPMVQLLNADGTFNADAPTLVQGAYFKKGGKLVTADLEEKELLFKKENYHHSYPHCYRCGTALIYNAVSSWFINVQAVKDKLLAENEKINWIPTHLKEGRFRKIIETAPDWTISRNRFWASPLPIWKDKKGNVRVVGSREELASLTKKSGNKYFVMRHGEAESNVREIMSDDSREHFSLTEKGKESVYVAAKKIKNEQITKIFTSPVTRTKETAEIVGREFGVPIEIDDRLREFNFGSFNGRSLSEFLDWRNANPLNEKLLDGESYYDIRRRVGDFLYDIESSVKGENILIVTHGACVDAFQSVVRGLDDRSWEKLVKEDEAFANSECVELPFVPLPHNADYGLDYHLPYIDQVTLENEQGEPLTRIPEVVDCWVESGSMPFAEYNYPFKGKDEFEKRTPGDFISEYIGQTRAWFYYMHVMSVQLFGHRAFKNVITTGNINAADGQKISKSKQNYTDPYVLFDTYGSDAFRFYLMSSVVMQAEDVQFKDEEIKEIHNKVINIFRNTLAFYLLYQDEAPQASDGSDNVLDRWILDRLEETIQGMTYHFDQYNTVRGTRLVREFVEDFSTWYVRRSRDRVRGDDVDDARRALATMRYVLREFSKVIAPVMPFMADEVYRAVREESEPESVHLCDWPVKEKSFFEKLFGGKKKASSLVADMREVRELVSLALEARQTAGMKVRQPLGKLSVNTERLLGKHDLLDLIKDEVNVKEVIVQTSTEERINLDTMITPELKEEGEVRELMREIQDLRKKAGLEPKDMAVLTFAGDTAFLEKHWEDIKRVANLVEWKKGDDTSIATS